MRPDIYIRYDIEKTFGIKINREIFSKKFIFLNKVKFSKEKAISKFAVLNIPDTTDTDTNSIINVDKVFPSLTGEKPELLKDKVLIVPYLYESELKFLDILKLKSVITKKVFLDLPIKSFSIPVFELKSIKDININEFSFKQRSRELSGTNLFFDIGYGSYYFLIILPYDSIAQSIDSLDFYSSYKVIKELIRRTLEVSAPKGYRIRFLFSDMLYHNNVGLAEHIKNINMDKILAVMNLQGCGAGNEKLVIKNYRYVLDEYTQLKISTIANKIGEKVEKIYMENYSNIDLIIEDIPVIWFYSYPNKFRTKLHYSFLPREKIKKTSYILFSILKNLYREI